MIILKKYCTICFILISVLLFDCDRDNKTNCAIALCTQEYRFINIQIKQSTDSSTVHLTDYKVFRVSDNKDITINDNVLNDNLGYYPLVNDSERAMLRNINVEIEFQGYIRDTLIIKKRFVVTADCCHVSLVSGDFLLYI